MARVELSRPVAIAIEDGVIEPGMTIFDYGCGRGGDLKRLSQLGFEADGWDPIYRCQSDRIPADVVNLGYVINVIESPSERRDVLQEAWKLALGSLVVAARPSWEARGVNGRPFGDGLITSSNAFQRFYEQDELRLFIESSLGHPAMAAAPGIFYVFRDDKQAQQVLAGRSREGGRRSPRVSETIYERHRDDLQTLQQFVSLHRRLPQVGELGRELEQRMLEELGSIRAAFQIIRRATGIKQWVDVDLGRSSRSEHRLQQHRDLLDPLMDFMEERGRVPQSEELICSQEIENEFGSIRLAAALIRRVMGEGRWRSAMDRARQNFLVYLALAAFGARPRFGELPLDLQLDVRAFFGHYKEATKEADDLLFGVGNQEALVLASQGASVGKLTPEALYIHISSISQLPPVLRVYEGCGRALCGTVEEATIIKLHREKPQVSYSSYPTFDIDPHPALESVVIARLRQLNVSFRDYRESTNPPILHRKETFVDHGYPNREKFARLSAQEEKFGLLSSAEIGTRTGWNDVLSRSGLTLRGHRVIRARTHSVVDHN